MDGLAGKYEGDFSLARFQIFQLLSTLRFSNWLRKIVCQGTQAKCYYLIEYTEVWVLRSTNSTFSSEATNAVWEQVGLRAGETCGKKVLYLGNHATLIQHVLLFGFSPTNIWRSNYCPWPLTLGERISRPALEEVDIVSAKLERGPSHECTWWLVVLDYRQGHRTSVHDQQVLQVLHNNVVFNQIVKNCQHQPCQSLFLIKVFQLSDATHICKPSGRKWLEIRVCEIYKRCRLVPSAPGNNARRWIPRSRRVVGCKAVQTYSLPPLLLLSWVGANTSNWGTTCATDPPISVVLIIQTIFDFSFAPT